MRKDQIIKLFYGENGLTVQWVDKFIDNKRGRIRYRTIKQLNNMPNEYTEIMTSDKMILFWNFGKKYGFGEPDIIVLPKSNNKPVVIVEAEISAFDSKGKPKQQVCEQIARYFYLAEAIKQSKDDDCDLSFIDGRERSYAYRIENIPEDWKNTYHKVRSKIQGNNWRVGLLEFGHKRGDFNTLFDYVAAEINSSLSNGWKKRFVLLDREIHRSKRI